MLLEIFITVFTVSCLYKSNNDFTELKVSAFSNKERAHEFIKRRCLEFSREHSAQITEDITGLDSSSMPIMFTKVFCGNDGCKLLVQLDSNVV